MKVRIALALGALAIYGLPNANAQDITVGGQVRPRFEFRNPELGGTVSDAFTSMRTRGDITAALEGGLKVFVQFQDVRLWGEEESTLDDFSANNFDLHQGWLEIRSSKGTQFFGRAGRQETNFGGQRLVGAVDWTQQGRSFDGIRTGAIGGFGSVDLVAYKLAEATDPDIDSDSELFGGYAALANILGGTLDAYALYDRIGGTPKTSRATVGARLHGRRASITYRIEGSYQLGTASDLDVTAFMVGARVGATFGKISLTGWYDYLSGDDDPTDGKSNVFNTLFATNHKFYGIADLFLNIPVHTGGLGLQDFAIKGSFTPIAPVLIGLDVHHFRTAKQGSLTSSRYGEEIDLVGRYVYNQYFTVSGGLAYVVQGPAWSELGRLGENMIWTYVMLDMKF
jgi:hypothetical protein